MTVDILTFGSCRIHGPMREIAASGRCVWSHGGSPAYLHSMGELLQRLEWAQGARVLDDRFAPYCFSTRKTPAVMQKSRRPIDSCDLLLAEISSAKELICEGVYLQLNYLHRNLLSGLGEAGASWWREVVAQGQASPAGADRIIRSAAFREKGFTDFDATVLRETRCVVADADRLDAAFRELRRLWRKPIAIVSHVGLPLADGARLAERESFIDLLRAACAKQDIPCFEPSSLIPLVGRAFALEKDGDDLDHVNPTFEPIYGWYLLNRVVEPALAAAGQASACPGLALR